MNQPRILVVEDEAIVTMEIEERLTAMGYEVAGVASSGEQALFFTREHRPDLVLMDIRLEGDMDGISAAEQIRDRFQVPVIFLTAYSEDSTLERAKRSEPYGYLLKPFNDRELKSTMEIALYRRRAEEELRRMNRLYNLLSQVNQAIVRIDTRQELLETVCRLLVERGAVDLAWVGCLVPGTSRLQPIATFGSHGETVFAQSSFEAQPYPGRVIIKGESESPGFKSCASFPLWLQAENFGALNICVRKPGFFREKEIQLLEEVAADISFALDKIEGDRRRKHAEKSLADSEQRMRLFIEHAPASLAMFDREMRYLSVSNRWLGNYNLDGRDLTGLSHYEVFPDLPEEWKKAHRRALAGEVVIADEDRFERVDGSVHWLMWEVRPWRDSNGDIGGIVIFTENITERKRREKELERLFEQNKRILDAAGEGIVGLDGKGRTTFANRAALEILGYESHELIGASLHELTHHHRSDGRPYPEGECPTYSTLKAGVPVRIRDEMLWRKDGTGFPAAYSATPIVEDGKVSGAVVTFRDITLRMKALDALRESEEKYRNIFENAVEGIFQTTSEGRFVSVNPTLANMCGFKSPGDMVSSVVDIANQIYINPESRAQFKTILETDGIARNFETQIRRTDGRLLWVSINARAVRDGHGNLLCYEGTIEDISERKRLEEERAMAESQLRQAQKLEALGTLAGGVAHDFNNILSIIMGYAELSRMDAEPGSGISQNLQEILTASARARELVKQILAFSRRSEHQKLSLRLDVIVKEAMKILRPSLPSTIEIKTEVLGKSTVLADPTQMHQVLMNLCTNAAHSMRDNGGVLEVRLRDIVLAAEDIRPLENLKPGRYIELTVKDTGHGVDPGIIGSIFDPFFTTKELGEGTGLGLSVVHGIVKSYAGAINVESTVGKGTAFTVLIPAIETATERNVEATAAPLSRGQERVLVVDDEPALAEMVRTMLARLGYEAVSCTNGTEALKTFKEKSFDLVVTDMTMPHLTGEDLAGEIYKLRPEVPVILMTGFSEKIDAEKAKRLGIKGFLMKPVVMNNLAALIRRLVEKKD